MWLAGHLLLSLLLGGCSTEGASAPASDGAGADTGADASAAPPDADAAAGAPDAAAGPAAPAFEPSAGFLARQAEYLTECSAQSAPEQGGFYGQVCRVATGASEYAQVAIDEACAKVDARQDTADFRVAGLVRLLYLDRAGDSPLPDAIRDQIETTLRGFRFWLTEPGDDKMCFWTENHQILFHSGELLAGQLFPDAVFSNSGMTGAEHVAHAEPLLERWLDLRGRLGFSEWHSNVYFNEDIPALTNLVDFAESEVLRTKAAMVLDSLAFDLLTNMYRGHFATTHGRTYSSKFLDGLHDSTSDWAWVALGLGARVSAGNFSAAFLATSSYAPPPLLEALAAAAAPTFEHRQRDSLDVVEGPDFGVGYTSTEDVVVWAGLAGLAAPEVIEGMVAMLDEHDLWDGFLFGDIPEPYKGMLQSLAETDTGLYDTATEMELVSRGIALEAVDTYTWRTPHFQLSGAQDYKPGYFGAQTQIWQATLDAEAYVFTSSPGQFDEAGFGLDFGGEWIGGWLPRATLYENVAVAQHRAGDVPLLGEYLTADYLHAYFPKARFDEVREEPPWVFGRKGEGFVALASEHPTRWSEEHDYELIADVTANTWVLELGSADLWPDFDAFVAAVGGAELVFDEGAVTYASPTVGAVDVAWEGAMLVDGEPADLGPYPRWHNAFCSTARGSWVTIIEDPVSGDRLELDFEAGERRAVSGGVGRRAGTR